MSRSTVRNQLKINDGLGNKLSIGTSTFITSAVNVDEHRRVSFTIGVTSATGAIGDNGGFTGTLTVQGTNELAECNGATGTAEAGNTSRPGINGFSGARFWSNLQSGTFNIDNTIKGPNSLMLSFTDIGAAFVRVVFNQTATGALPNSVGSGLMHIYLSAKNT